jgi:hypothetical protein
MYLTRNHDTTGAGLYPVINEMVQVRSEGTKRLHLRIQLAMNIGNVGIRDHISAGETFRISESTRRTHLPEVWVPSNYDRFIHLKE